VKIVAGLGNPGAKYRGTRHNVGFEVLDELARRHNLAFDAAPADALQAKWRIADGVMLVKPLTFMNLSGEAVAALLRYYRVDAADLLVVCDDVNLPVGRLRVRASGSDGGNNGLKSVALNLGTTEYARLRIGVGRGDMRRDLSAHVLGGFAPEEQTGVQEAIARSADAVELWIGSGLAPVMNLFNRPQEEQ
jgi:PTH1 family peptidyl-tRNA hydrolase